MTKDQLLTHIQAMSVREGDCLIWTGSFSGNNQPMIRLDGVRRTVRSVVMQILKGKPTPAGSVASNTCECSKCVEPEHVLNISRAKMLERSRRNTNQELRAARIAAAKVHERKLTDEDVQMILSSDKTGLALAAELGVHNTLISRYRRGKSVRARRQSNPFAGLGSRS